MGPWTSRLAMSVLNLLPPKRRFRLVKYARPGSLRHMQRHRFRNLIRYVAKHSRFYRRRFSELGIDPATVTSPADLGDFYTSSQDLLENDPEEFLCSPPRMGFETTGTTLGKNKRIYFGLDEMDSTADDAPLGFYNLGYEDGDTIVSTMHSAFWNAGETIRAAARKLNGLYVNADKVPPEEFLERAGPYAFDIVVCEPSWLVLLTDLAREGHLWPVKFFIVGGENMSETARRHVEQVWNTDVYLAYGMTETFGSAGLECPAKVGYHVNESQLWYEIKDASGDGWGELVVTTLQRHVMPLIRYRTADVTRFVEGECTCQLGGIRRIAKIRGRCDELINCGMGNISPPVFERLLDGVEGITSDWQCAVLREGSIDHIEVRVETETVPGRPDLEAEVLENLRVRFPDYWGNREMGLFRFSLDTRPPGTLRTKNKLRRLVDERSYDE